MSRCGIKTARCLLLQLLNGPHLVDRLRHIGIAREICLIAGSRRLYGVVQGIDHLSQLTARMGERGGRWRPFRTRLKLALLGKAQVLADLVERFRIGIVPDEPARPIHRLGDGLAGARWGRENRIYRTVYVGNRRRHGVVWVGKGGLPMGAVVASRAVCAAVISAG